MNRTPIEWCRTYAEDGSYTEGYSVNPIRFRPFTGFGHLAQRAVTMCQKVSPGCKNCYAETIGRRFWPKDAAVTFPGYTAAGLQAGEFELDEAKLLAVLKHRKPCRIFWGDMTDLFGDWVIDEWLDRILAVCALTPHITHIFLTKRERRMCKYLSHKRTRGIVGDWMRAMSGDHETQPEWPIPNAQFGVSVEDQPQADIRIPLLLDTPVAVRFISCEPLVGPVEISSHRYPALWSSRLEWVICGGESGRGARPMHPDWARSLRDQCVAAGVPFFFKQWGEWRPNEDCSWVQSEGCDNGEFHRASASCGNEFILGCLCCEGDPMGNMRRVGKSASGDLLDGQRWHQFPEVRRG